MHADVSRWSFRPEQGFSAVVVQQGRLLLDAESNEQAAIDAERARTLTADLLGPYAGPAGRAGFLIEPVDGDPPSFTVSGGPYYVDGLRADATRPPSLTVVTDDGPVTTDTPPSWSSAELVDGELPDRPFLVYLEVRETLVTAVNDPSLREPALGPTLPDTAARLRTTWRVLPARDFPLPEDRSRAGLRTAFDRWIAERTATGTPIAVRARRPESSDEPCLADPGSAFRGEENALYRIEIHRGGDNPTYVWSRDNGSVVLPIAEVDGEWVTLGVPGRDDKLSVHLGDRVELLDDDALARGEPGPLPQVVDVDPAGSRVRLSAAPAAVDPARHPFLRRWDHRTRGRARAQDEGALPVERGTWLDLEDGVQVWFGDGPLLPGQFWLAPARTLTGDVDWPRDPDGNPVLRTADGPVVRHAPLAFLDPETVTDLRRTFEPLPGQ